MEQIYASIGLQNNISHVWSGFIQQSLVMYSKKKKKKKSKKYSWNVAF